MNITLKKSNYFKHQWDFITDNQTKILGLVSGFSAGKTHALIRKVLYHHINNKDKNGQSMGLVCYPTHNQAQLLFIRPFLKLLDSINIKYKYSSQGSLILTKYGLIHIVTMANKKALSIQGFNATYCCVDLLDRLSTHVALAAVLNLLARLRAGTTPQLFITTTADGYKYAYKLFVEDAPNYKEQIRMIKASTYDNTKLEPGYILTLKALYDAKRFEMYVHGLFVNLSGTQAVYNFDRNLHTIDKRNDISNDELIYIGMDFNVNPMTALVVYKTLTNGKVSFYVDELIILPNSNTYMMVDNIKLNYQGRRFRTICDVSGKSRKTSSYETDFKILQLAGLDPFGKKISLRDKLNNMNMLFKQGRILINKKCKVTIRDMLSVTLDDDGKIDCRDKRLTHALDALGYLVYILSQLKNYSQAY